MKSVAMVVCFVLCLPAFAKSNPSSARTNSSSIATLQAKAQAGDAHAQSMLCISWALRDHPGAIFWCRKAAEQGDAPAQYILGEMYNTGHGVPQDYAQAVVWYRNAAEQGQAAAETNLCEMYGDGHGVPQDYAEAFDWCRKAAEQGTSAAQYSLGMSYYRGLGVPQDYAQAYFWLDLAASGSFVLTTVKQEDVYKTRDDAASHLTPAVLSQEQDRAQKWFESHSQQTGARQQYPFHR